MLFQLLGIVRIPLVVFLLWQVFIGQECYGQLGKVFHGIGSRIMLGSIDLVQLLKRLLVANITSMVIAIVVQSFFHGLIVTVNDFLIVVAIWKTFIMVGMTEFMQDDSA